MTKLLSNNDIKGLLSPRLVFNTVERTWEEYANGKVVNPAKLSLDLGESGVWPHIDGYMNAMPAYVDWLDVAGLKWAGGFWGNTKLPSIMAMILLIQPMTGYFKCVLEGSEITAYRTAAQSAVGIKYLAKEDSETIGIFGAGLQARYHIMLISSQFPDMSFKVYDVKNDASKKLKVDLSSQVKSNIEIVEHPEQCVDSDVLITVTTSKNPFFKADWIREGALVLFLGSYQEAFPEVFSKADRIIVDHIQQTIHRGALRDGLEHKIIKEEDIRDTIGEIISRAKPGRTNKKEKIIFIPIGTGMLDIAIAELAYRKALLQEVGSEFEFYESTQNII